MHLTRTSTPAKPNMFCTISMIYDVYRVLAGKACVPRGGPEELARTTELFHVHDSMCHLPQEFGCALGLVKGILHIKHYCAHEEYL